MLVTKKTYIWHKLIPDFDTGPGKVIQYIHCYWLKGFRNPNSTYPCQCNQQNMIGTGSSLFEDNRLQSYQFPINTDPFLMMPDKDIVLFQTQKLVALWVLLRSVDQSVCAETDGRSKTNIAHHLTFSLFCVQRYFPINANASNSCTFLNTLWLCWVLVSH